VTRGVDRRPGRYTLIRELSHAASPHAIYLAHDAADDTVVLKRLRDTHRDREDLALRLTLEADVLAQLAASHGIVRLIAVDADPLTLVMEHVGGSSLADRLGDARSVGITIPLGRVLCVANGLLTALAQAHDHGVVHRDVKPSNVMFATDGTVRLIDFGVAARSDPARGGGHYGLPADWIEERVGTLPYAAPESVLAPSAPATPRQDIYSAGVVLFEMLTGTRPWEVSQGEHPEAFAERVMRRRAGPALPASVPLPVADAVRAALAPDPTTRPSATAMMKSLGAAGNSE
jgi:serine/threonine protein kinase